MASLVSIRFGRIACGTPDPGTKGGDAFALAPGGLILAAAAFLFGLCRHTSARPARL